MGGAAPAGRNRPDPVAATFLFLRRWNDREWILDILKQPRAPHQEPSDAFDVNPVPPRADTSSTMERRRRTLTFTKGDSRYAVAYRDVRELIHGLVDLAEDPRHEIDLMDVFLLVHRLAATHAVQAAGAAPETAAAPHGAGTDSPIDIQDHAA